MTVLQVEQVKTLQLRFRSNLLDQTPKLQTNQNQVI